MSVSERTAARARLGILRSYLTTEAGGALVLLAATVFALAWANSPFRDSYDAVWATDLSLRLGDLSISHDLQDWVNDGLMTLFFLLIGLEVRREFDMGEFRERRRVAVPVIAALGGMAVPVLIFLALNPGGETARGWAMVMTTDTAFAVGVLALVGSKSSFRLRTFLLTLVIVDDVAAVLIIALVYSTDVQLLALAVGIGLLGLMAFLRWRGLQAGGVHVLLGIGVWLASSAAGVHPTVGGVAIGLLTSAYPPRRATLEDAIGMTRAFRQRPTPDLAAEATRRITLSLSPNERLQHALHPWTSFVVVPLFAVANAGVHLSGETLADALASPLVHGIVLGLVAGKTIGIPLGAWLATRPWLGGARLTVGWPSLLAGASVAGIGFTMSLLIAELSYSGETLELAKLGVLGASTVAAILSYALFHLIELLPREWLGRAEARAAPMLADLRVPIDPTRDHLRGPDAAAITLLEYGDYECPYCGRAEPIVRRLVEEFGGRVRFAFRHLPLPDVHPNAALAAQAAEAAGAQGRFWEMHELLFAHQDALQPHHLIEYARELGLDVERFTEDLREHRFASRVGQDVSSAEEAGVAGTPTFFINEVQYHGPPDAESLAAAVRRAAAIVAGRARLAAVEALEGVPRSAGEQVELIRVLLEVVDDEPLHDAVHRHLAQRGMHAAAGPCLGRQRAGRIGHFGQRGANQRQQGCGIGVAVTLDGLGAGHVGLGSTERDRLVGGQGDHALGLRQPVRRELGEVRPDLARLPALVRGRIGIGQAGRRWRRRVLIQALLHGLQAGQQGVDRGAHRSGPSVTEAPSVPRRSMLRLTTSPARR